jgi:hypothetical protein
MKQMMTVVDVLRPLADDRSLVLFNTIALSKGDSDIIITRIGLTRKQYYSRLSALLKAGLVKRERGKYSLTTFGVILYHIQEIIGKAVNQYWKLKAIDSIRASANVEVPQEQVHSIIEKLIPNQEIKNILLERIKEKSSICETWTNQIPVLNLQSRSRL